MDMRLLVLGLILPAIVLAGRADAAPKTAVLPFEMVIELQMGHMGLPPTPSPAEQKRLDLVTGELTRLLKGTGLYDPLDLTTVNCDISEMAPFNSCNGCEAEIAKKAGADLSVLGVVHKASEMLLNVSIFVRDANDGKLHNSMSVSIRRNDDEGWLRAVRWLVRNRLSSKEPKE